jgi:hypothetical protein
MIILNLAHGLAVTQKILGAELSPKGNTPIHVAAVVAASSLRYGRISTFKLATTTRSKRWRPSWNSCWSEGEINANLLAISQ